MKIIFFSKMFKIVQIIYLLLITLLQTDRKLTTSDVRVIKWITGMTVDAIFEESPYISSDWLI